MTPPRTWPSTLLWFGLAPVLGFTSCAQPSVAPTQPPAPSALTIHVSPRGRDYWSGLIAEPAPGGTNGPVATLKGACDAARRARSRATPGSQVTILLADGSFPLTEPVVFGPADSGTPNAPLLIAAAPNSRPILDGGKRISGWQVSSNGTWTVHLSEVAAGRWYFEQLYVDGRIATRARSPNSPAYFYIDAPAGPLPNPETRRTEKLPARSFAGRPEDLVPLRELQPTNLTDVVVTVYHHWEVSRHRLAAWLPSESVLLLTGDARQPFLAPQVGDHQRYHLENFPAALDAPGEWFLDRSGLLSYRPLPGEDPASTPVFAPVVTHFLRCEGDPLAGRSVSDITLRGLTFRHSAYQLPPRGAAELQAASSIAAALLVDHATRIRIEGCDIGPVATYGVWFRRDCTDSSLDRCFLHDLGAGGVRIGEADLPGTTNRVTGGVTIENNLILSGGHIHPGAVGVWIGQSPGNLIRHNEIADLAYTGISVGWTWGYRDSRAVSNRIELNHVHHLGRRVLSDLGGIYTLGISPGTVIRHNWIHDVEHYDYAPGGSWGIYNDEGSTGILIENNLVHDIGMGCYYQNYGRENLVRNNLFIYRPNGQFQRPSGDVRFERNLFLWNGGSIFRGAWPGSSIPLSRNLYWDATGRAPRFGDFSFDEWKQRTKDTGSRVANPRLLQAPPRTYRLSPQSPAFQLGFVDFDPYAAGIADPGPWYTSATNRLASLRPAPAPAPPTKPRRRP